MGQKLIFSGLLFSFFSSLVHANINPTELRLAKQKPGERFRELFIIFENNSNYPIQNSTAAAAIDGQKKSGELFALGLGQFWLSDPIRAQERGALVIAVEPKQLIQCQKVRISLEVPALIPKKRFAKHTLRSETKELILQDENYSSGCEHIK